MSSEKKTTVDVTAEFEVEDVPAGVYNDLISPIGIYSIIQLHDPSIARSKS